jgi:ABC-2 type transport system permease protein
VPAHVSLYAGFAVRGFRRYASYRGATLAGVFTNTVFGVIIAFTYIALWDQRPQLGGYGVAQALTFCWISQALIMPVGLFGGAMVTEYSDRVRTGAVVTDLQRPVPLLAVRLAEDLGRAAYHLLSRGVAPLLLGALVFELAWPSRASTWVLFLVSVVLAVVTGFALRYLLGLLAFWVVETAGFAHLLVVLQIFCSGSMLPLVVFPDWARTLCEALPFRCLVQVPVDVLLRDDTGTAAWPLLGLQLLWAAALLGLAAALTRLAVRLVVVQGG